MTVRKTTNTVGQIPSISRVVDKVALEQTPFLSSLKKEVIGDTKHTWHENYGFNVSAGGQSENGDAAPTTFIDNSSKFTYLEIFKGTVSASGSELATDKAGAFNTMKVQKLELAIALKKNIEQTLLGDQATSIVGDIRKLGGVRSQLHADHIRDNAGTTVFTAADLASIASKAWSGGAKRVSLFVPMEGYARMNPLLLGSTTVNASVGEKVVTGTVVAKHMVPGLGILDIVISDQVKGAAPADTKYDILGLDTSKFTLLTAKDRYMSESVVDQNGRDGIAEQILCEVGLKHANAKAGFAMINVKK